MGFIIGFSLSSNLEDSVIKKLGTAQKNVLSGFDHLSYKSFTQGVTQLHVWGHEEISDHKYSLPDGSMLVLIGSPHNKVAWKDVQDKLFSSNFELPWEGRVILIHISADGKHWTMWNDWLGSIPVFHAEIGRGRIASTLEPVVVAAAGYTPDDFFMPGLVSLMINGHLISDWTLYQSMKTVLPDSVAKWDENGYRVEQVWSVKPSQSRWETSWDDLVDEMYELSHQAIAGVLKTQSSWILPLSSGLDSRLIAGVAADVGANLHTYAWGEPNTTDVVYSQQIAKTLGYPWKHIKLPKDFLVQYTKRWANLFGSGMHFHGMYQMAFLDQIGSEPSGSIISGLISDTLSGDPVVDNTGVHSKKSYQLGSKWYSNWSVELLKNIAKFPVDDALEENYQELKKLIDSSQGAFFQKLQYLELWCRQRLFTGFQSTIADYWRGVANPFLTRAYASFCMSLPRVALDHRQLLADVYRRYYGRLAVIPGTYGVEPFILTGRYALKRRIVEKTPSIFHNGLFRGFGNVQLRLDFDSIQLSGKEALSPLFNRLDILSDWFDIGILEKDYQLIMRSKDDVLPLRRLQSLQTLAYRLALQGEFL